MALPNDQLFLDRFVAFNVNRYKDEQRTVSVLQALTLGNTTFSNFRKVTKAGEVRHFVDVDSPNRLKGVDQEYTPADYTRNNTAVLIEKDPVTLDDLKHKDVEGIYYLGETLDAAVGALLVLQGARNANHIKEKVKSSCLYDLKDTEITVAADLNTVTIDSRTIVGRLQVVESEYDDVPRYNGQYAYDGSITYQ